jgi:hypothetical protein
MQGKGDEGAGTNPAFTAAGFLRCHVEDQEFGDRLPSPSPDGGRLQQEALRLTYEVLGIDPAAGEYPWPRRTGWQCPLGVLLWVADALLPLVRNGNAAATVALAVTWRAFCCSAPDAEALYVERVRERHRFLPGSADTPDLRAALEAALAQPGVQEESRRIVRAVLDDAEPAELLALLRPDVTASATKRRPRGKEAPEDRALAYLARAIREGQDIPSMAECARAAGCSRAAVKNWSLFQAAHRTAKAGAKSGSVRRGYRDARTPGELECAD